MMLSSEHDPVRVLSRLQKVVARHGVFSQAYAAVRIPRVPLVRASYVAGGRKVIPEFMGIQGQALIAC